MTTPSRPRGSQNYAKPPLPLDDLVDRLVERGLTVPDRERAVRYLRHIGYYRLSPYTIPFQRDRTHHLMEPGTTFDDVLDLYVFDRRLRLIVMDALERVEVAVRAALTDHMATSTGDAHWYTDARHFKDRGRHSALLKKVQESCDRHSDAGTPKSGDPLIHASALEHYLSTYGKPDLPPSWLMIETLTIGQLANLFRNLGGRADRTAVARSVGLEAPVLASWLQTYVRVRNVCAHHGRLWNLGLGVYPMIPKAPSIPWLKAPRALPRQSEQRLYPVLVSLQSVLCTVSPRSSWATRLKNHLDGRPEMNLRGMGVPPCWANDPFWQRSL